MTQRHNISFSLRSPDRDRRSDRSRPFPRIPHFTPDFLFPSRNIGILADERFDALPCPGPAGETAFGREDEVSELRGREVGMRGLGGVVCVDTLLSYQ